MARRGPKTDQQFRYWHMVRTGKNQADIAREHGVSRQAVSKAVQTAEREVVFQLLDTAQMSGVLVEWYDARLGILIGITPQLGNLACILVIDVAYRPRLFFDQSQNTDVDVVMRTMEDIREVLSLAIGLELDHGATFKDIIDRIVKQKRTGG
ncbi:MAG: hypothetical protein JSW25_07350 [Thermoplasmata archaeon]|nr:MAG: hypothetical protein JSW25_07350 [Thermoplasmata archaeon]